MLSHVVTWVPLNITIAQIDSLFALSVDEDEGFWLFPYSAISQP
jgi:hypothetical protein